MSQRHDCQLRSIPEPTSARRTADGIAELLDELEAKVLRAASPAVRDAIEQSRAPRPEHLLAEPA